MKKLITRILAVFLTICLTTGSIPAAGLPSAFSSKSQSVSLQSRDSFEREALIAGALWSILPYVTPSASFVRRHAEDFLTAPPSKMQAIAALLAVGVAMISAILPQPGDGVERQAKADFFLHNDGIDFASYVAIMSRNGVLSFLASREQVSLTDVVLHLQKTHQRVNVGFVKIGLRLLADQGWVTQHEEGDELIYRPTSKGRFVVNHPGILDAYERAASYIQTELSRVDDIEENFPFTRPSTTASFEATTFEDWIGYATALDAFHIPDATGTDAEFVRQIKTELWGTLLGPTAAALAFHGVLILFEGDQWVSLDQIVFHSLKKDVVDARRIRSAFDLFVAAGWMRRDDKTMAYQLTPLGKVSVGRAGSYGVPVSYLPMFAHLGTLYFGNAEEVFALDTKGHERHVARAMNIFGSEAAHIAHFKRFIPELAKLFDNDDFGNQPQFIVDMGAGTGAFLKLAYEYVKNNTQRGKHLTKYPLWVVGADYNLKALETMKRTFTTAGIETFHVVPGDINDPDALAEALRRLGLDPVSGLHTSTFLIHNRPWLVPSQMGRKGNPASGSFVAPRAEYAAQGYAVANGDLDQNLLDWISRWKPYLKRFGMFFIELHSAPPEVTARNAGVFAGTSYDATHFTSGQYIIPIPYFLKLMDEAGMEAVYVQPMPKPKNDDINVPNGLYHFRAKEKASMPIRIVNQNRPLAQTIFGSSLALGIFALSQDPLSLPMLTAVAGAIAAVLTGIKVNVIRPAKIFPRAEIPFLRAA